MHQLNMVYRREKDEGLVEVGNSAREDKGKKPEVELAKAQGAPFFHEVDDQYGNQKVGQGNTQLSGDVGPAYPIGPLSAMPTWRVVGGIKKPLDKNKVSRRFV